MGTLRQRMIAVLQGSPMDRRQLSQALRISEKEVSAHLPHVARSVVSQGLGWHVQPAYCDTCGFAFKDRKRLSPPSKCPRCRTSRIVGPWFQVRAAIRGGHQG